MIPTQVRSVDPFSSYESDNVNRLTRILTAGEDKIARDEDLYVTLLNSTEVSIAAGVCVVEDVMIQFENDITFDLSLDANYTSSSGMDTTSASYPYGYLVLTYNYVKDPDPNVAEIKVLTDRSLYDHTEHLFLAMLKFTAAKEIQTVPSGVYVEDTSPLAPSYTTVTRPIANLDDPYTDTDARDAQSENPITNHRAAEMADRDKVVVTDSTTGAIRYEDRNDFARPVTADYTSGDYVAGNLTITHNYSREVTVNVFEYSGGSYHEIEPANIQQSTTAFVLNFDGDTPDIRVQYM